MSDLREIDVQAVTNMIVDWTHHRFMAHDAADGPVIVEEPDISEHEKWMARQALEFVEVCAAQVFARLREAMTDEG